MEKFTITTQYVPPNARNDKQIAARKVDNGADSHWQVTEKSSFESALNKFRDRKVSTDEAIAQGSDKAQRPSANRDVQGVNLDGQFSGSVVKESSGVNIDELAEIQEAPASVDTNLIPAALVHPTFFDTSDSVSDSYVRSSEQSVSVPIETAATDISRAPAEASSIPSAGSSLRAETVGQMMARLERTPGTHSGQWEFGVLNEETGVSSLQLERSLNGGWRVNVSFDGSSQIDETLQAEELKDALLKEGHDVDSVEISNLETHAALDND